MVPGGESPPPSPHPEEPRSAFPGEPGWGGGGGGGYSFGPLIKAAYRRAGDAFYFFFFLREKATFKNFTA